MTPFDPQALPILGVDSHLPAIDPGALTLAALRRRFRQPPVWSPEIRVEPTFGDRPPAHAAVLIALVLRESVHVLLTVRTEHLTDHAGQISFPGGRVEPEDADAAATALREAHEEIGLAAEHVEVLGAMPTYTTGTGFVVTPVVGWVRPGFTLEIEPFEVAEVFEAPLAFLLNPARHERRQIEVGGVVREFWSMPWEGIDSAGQPRRYFIWGATASMLRNLYRFFAA